MFIYYIMFYYILLYTCTYINTIQIYNALFCFSYRNLVLKESQSYFITFMLMKCYFLKI